MNPVIDQKDIENYLSKRKSLLPKNIVAYSKIELYKYLGSLKPLNV